MKEEEDLVILTFKDGVEIRKISPINKKLAKKGFDNQIIRSSTFNKEFYRKGDEMFFSIITNKHLILSKF